MRDQVAGGDRRWADIVADTTIPTTTPDETISATTAWIRDTADVDAVGIACFGPLDPTSPDYGSITATPKPHWSRAAVLDRVEEMLGVPAAIDVDGGGAALGEWRWGAATGTSHFI